MTPIPLGSRPDQKNEVIAEVMESHVAQKQILGKLGIEENS